jgi:prepilin-type N-terminal cleavage/methylation domain-containing protein
MSGRQKQAGFSLLELSVVLTIIAVITAMGMSMGNGMIESAKRAQTNNKLNVIEDALMAYRTAYNRLPCPADPTIANTSANYGVEAANAGSCTGGTPAIAAATTDAANNVVEGAVPFKTLGLPEEFMYDGWGRKFAYAVNYNVTAANAMLGEALSDQCGISVTDAGGGAGARTSGAVYALVSYGPDGHGGYLKSGSRNNAGSTNTDELTNCHCNTATAAETTYAANYVAKDATQNPASSTDQFGDYVRFSGRWQMATADNFYQTGGNSVCSPRPGFRLDGNVTNGCLGFSVAVGDVNHDGYQDLVVVANTNCSQATPGYIYVLLGSATGYSNMSVSALNGTNGFTLKSSVGSPISQVAVGDIDGDGYDDIVVGAPYSTSCCGTNASYVFYGSAGPFTGGTSGTGNSTYDLDSMDACQGFKIFGGSVTYSFGDQVGVADFNKDGYKDIIITDPTAHSTNGYAYIIFGQTGAAKNCTTHTSPFGTGSPHLTIDPTALTNATSPKGTLIKGNSNAGMISFGNMTSVGDINGDGFADLIIGDPNYTYAGCGGSCYGRIVIIAGQTGTWPSTITVASLAGIAATSPGPACSAASATCGSIIKGGGSSAYFFGNTTTGDITGDGIADIVNVNISCINPDVIIMPGHSGAWSTTYNTPSTVPGEFLVTNAADAQGAGCINQGSLFGASVGIGDVNGDGHPDLIVADPYVTANGSTYVLFGPITAAWDVNTTPPNGTTGSRLDCPYSDNTTCGLWGVSATNLLNASNGGSSVVIPVNQGSPTGVSNGGYVYVLYGKSSGWTATYNLGTIK